MRTPGDNAVRTSRQNGAAYADGFGDFRLPGARPCFGSIADAKIAHYAFPPRGNRDAPLNIAVGLIVRSGRDDHPATIISVVVVMVVMMMMVVGIVELCKLYRGLRLPCPGQIVRDESLQGIRNRLQQVRIGLRRAGRGRRRMCGVPGQQPGRAA